MDNIMSDSVGDHAYFASKSLTCFYWKLISRTRYMGIPHSTTIYEVTWIIPQNEQQTLTMNIIKRSYQMVKWFKSFQIHKYVIHWKSSQKEYIFSFGNSCCEFNSKDESSWVYLKTVSFIEYGIIILRSIFN